MFSSHRFPPSYTSKFSILIDDAYRFMFRLPSMDGDEASEEVRSVQVSYPRQFFKVPGSSHRRVYFLRHQNYNILCICHPPSLPLGFKFNVTQSRECQKKAWKLTHKYKCIPNTLSAREEALLKPLRRVVDAWQKRWENVLDVFSILALDLENNPGKNKTHWSVLHSVMTFSSRNLFFFSLSMWLEFKYTGRGADSEKFKVGWFCFRSFFAQRYIVRGRRNLRDRGYPSQSSPTTNHARSTAASREASMLRNGVPFRRGG